MPAYPRSVPITDPASRYDSRKRTKLGRRTDLPVQSFTNWDSVGLVMQSLTDHDTGLFRTPSMLWDAMLRDDRIFGVLNTRIDALLGSKLSFKPADESAKAQQVADDLEEQWDKLFPAHALHEYMRWGIGLGAAIGELIPKRTTSSWGFTLKGWHPQFLYYNWGY